MAAYEGVRHAVQAGVELERPLAPATKQTPVRPNVHGFFILRFGPAALRCKGPALVPAESNRLQEVKSRDEKAELTRPFAVPPHRLRPLPGRRRDIGGEAREVRGNVGVELGLVDEVGDLPCAPTLG